MQKRHWKMISIHHQPKSVDREKLESIAETLGVDYTNKNDQDLRQAIESELKKQNNE